MWVSWAPVDDICLGKAHTPVVIPLKTNVLENGRPNFYTPCESFMQFKETESYGREQPSNLSDSVKCSKAMTGMNHATRGNDHWMTILEKAEATAQSLPLHQNDSWHRAQWGQLQTLANTLGQAWDESTLQSWLKWNVGRYDLKPGDEVLLKDDQVGRTQDKWS